MNKKLPVDPLTGILNPLCTLADRELVEGSTKKDISGKSLQKIPKP